jgi:predicted transcriptional regulator
MLDFLKTMPDMTNTQEITMHEPKKKPLLSERILAYKAANPDASQKTIAKALGTSGGYVSTVLSQEANKGINAPEKPISKKEVDALREEVEDQRMVIDALQKTIKKNMAVIEYLETKIDDMGGLVC